MTGKSGPLLIVGGGLAGGLLALALRREAPGQEFLLLEAGEQLGGQHTWSFHGSDLDAEDRDWVLPLATRSWSAHEVVFPSGARRFETSYHSIRSDDFHARLVAALGDRVRFSARAADLSETRVRLDSGQVLEACCVVDARGFSSQQPSQEEAGWQKFLGLDVELEQAHGLDAPVLMDARVEQKDGFRFLYLLPWDERRLLVEDTRYSDSPQLAPDELEADVRGYCEARGWKIRQVERREQGSLPIPLRPGICGSPQGAAPVIGVRAGLFHPTTGYSLPEAARLARRLARLPELVPGEVGKVLREFSGELDSHHGFFFLLNRMLFRAATPDRRRQVFETFYRHPDSLIARFYSGRLRWYDPGIILFRRRPPVPVLRAMQCLRSSSKGASNGF